LPYEIFVRPTAARELKKLPPEARESVGKAINSLADNPRPFGYEKLTDRKGFRYRVGNYRIVYDIQDKELVVEVIKVADRKEVYRKK